MAACGSGGCEEESTGGMTAILAFAAKVAGRSFISSLGSVVGLCGGLAARREAGPGTVENGFETNEEEKGFELEDIENGFDEGPDEKGFSPEVKFACLPNNAPPTSALGFCSEILSTSLPPDFSGVLACGLLCGSEALMALRALTLPGFLRHAFRLHPQI